MKKIFLVILTIVLLFIACSPEEDATESGKEVITSDEIIQNDVEEGYVQYVSSSGLSLTAESTWREVGGEQEYYIELEREDEYFRLGKRTGGYVSSSIDSCVKNIQEPIDFSTKEVDKIYNSNMLKHYNDQVGYQDNSKREIYYFTIFENEIPALISNYIGNGDENYIPESYSVEADFLYRGSNYFIEYKGKYEDGIIDEIEKILVSLKDEESTSKEATKFRKYLTEKEWKTNGEKELNIEFIPDAEDITCGNVYINGEYLGGYFTYLLHDYIGSGDDSFWIDFYILTYSGYSCSYTTAEVDKKKCKINVVIGANEGDEYILK